MTVLEIVKIPNKILKTPTEQVTDFSEVEQIIKDMIETAIANNLVGLAANQVNISKSIFIVHVGTKLNDDGNQEIKFVPFINPIVKSNREAGESWDWEGCGSLPGIQCLIKRWNKVSVKAQTSKGESFEQDASGLIARVIQHENWHLQGKLIIENAREKRIIK